MNGSDRSFAGFATNACPAGQLIRLSRLALLGRPRQVGVPSLQSVFRSDGLNQLRGKSGFTDKYVESVEHPTQQACSNTRELELVLTLDVLRHSAVDRVGPGPTVVH
jgi:hypothetical protein